MELKNLTAFTLIDTDILIDVSREISEAIACVDYIERNSSLAVSSITQMELIVGCRNKTELRKTDKFLRRFQIIKLDAQISDTATQLLRQYKLSHGLAIPDSLIAATAISYECDFITKNQRDYRFITGLSLLPYPLTNNIDK